MRPTPTTAPSPSLTRVELGLVASILVVALNLRLAITSLGAALDRIGADGTSHTVLGVLTSLPVLCFAVIGATTTLVTRRLGHERALHASLLLLAVGLVGRVLGGTATLLVGTVVACAGVALANVLIPAIVKERMPSRVGLVTGTYTASLSVGSALGAAATIPIANATGDWRFGLAAWAAVALLATVVWWPHVRGGRREVGSPMRATTLWKQPTAWAVTVLFGTQSTYAYVQMSWLPSVYADAGLSDRTAGALLALSVLVGVPFFLVAPTLAARARRTGDVVVALTVLTAAGWLGLLLAPAGAPWLWAALIGGGGAVFPITLSLFAARTATATDTAALSTMAQSIGYLIAAPGPFLVGALHDATGSWAAPITLLLALGVAQVAAGYLAGRRVVIESRPRA